MHFAKITNIYVQYTQNNFGRSYPKRISMEIFRIAKKYILDAICEITGSRNASRVAG